MAQNKKWRIKNLPSDSKVSDAAAIILNQRLDTLLSSIKTYFESSSAENLHSVRIAIRRLRYTMEIFYDFFNRKKFISIYKSIEILQDLSGVVRDFDVMKANIHSLSAEGKVKISSKILASIDEKKTEEGEKFQLELMKFYHSKSVKKFL